MPTVAYAENFQNVAASGTPESLASYTGAGGQGYAADPSWLPTAKLCNGWILNSADPVSSANSDPGCGANGGATGNSTGANTTDTAWFFLQQMTNQLGQAELNAAQGKSLTGSTTGVDPNAVASAQRAGITTAAENNAVSSQTNSTTGSILQAAGVQVQTTGTPVTAIPGHYYAVSAWFAEAHCPGDGTASQNASWAGTNALESLSLIINGDTANPVVLAKDYNPCLGTKVIGTYNTPIRVSFFQSSAVLLTTAENLGLQLYNANGGTTGNDVTFDLPEIVDVTPQMDKTFGTVDNPVTTVAAGVPVPMTITITNTTELAAKGGWSFTDNMGPTLSIAPGTTPTTDCNDPTAPNPNGTVQVVTNPDETTSLKVTGNLANGMAYCTISAMVVSDKAGDFTNGLENISDYVGLDLPGKAQAEIDVTPPTLSLNKIIESVEHPAGVTDADVTKSSDGKSATGLRAGDLVTYSYQVTNTSAVTLDDVWVVEADPAGATPTEYPFNGTMADGTTPTEAHPGFATAAELGANFNGSDVTPAVGSCTYDQDGAYGTQGSSVANGTIMLDPGESATCAGTYLVTQDDVNAYSQGTGGPAPYGVINTSVAIGTNYHTEDDTPSQQSASDTSTAIITFDTTHGLTLTKSATTGGSPVTALKANNVVDYSFLLVNTGKLTLTNVSVDDSGAYTNDQTVGFSGSGTLGAIGNCQLTPAGSASSSPVAYPVPSMQPGDTVTCTATYTMTQTDVDAGHLDNAADATGTTPDNQPEISDVSSLQLPASSAASLLVTKTASLDGTSPGSAGVTVTTAGQLVTFTVQAQNTGDVTLRRVTATDTGLTRPDSTNVSGPLVLGNCTLNDATSTPVTPGDSSITLNAYGAPGDTVTCTATYTVTQADIDAGAVLTNTTTVSGTSPSGSNLTDSGTATVTPNGTGALTVTKTATPSTVTAAGPVSFTITGQNTGTAALTGVTVTDAGLTRPDSTNVSGPLGVSNCRIGGTTVDNIAGFTLPAGRTVTCTATYNLTQADMDAGVVLTNTTTISGNNPDGSPVTGTDTATLTPSQTAELTLHKMVDPSDDAHFNVGQPLVYSFLVVNTGNVTITDLAINDDGTTPTDTVTGFTGVGPLSAITCPLTTLVPQGNPALPAAGSSTTCTATYTIAQGDVDDGVLDNTAVATGKDPSGADVTSNPSSAEIPGDPHPVVTLAKGHLTPPTPAAAGDTVTFVFTVSNRGNLTLDGQTLTVADNLAGISSITCPAAGSDWPQPDETLPPGTSVTCSATYTLTQADIDAGQVVNPQAVATISPVHSTTPVDSEPAGDTVPLTSVGGLTLDKTSTSAPTKAGDTISYSLVVANSGATTINALTLADTAFSGTGTAPVIACPTVPTDWASGTVGVLRPADTVTCTATYQVTQDDVDAGVVSNTALAHGTDINGPEDSNPSTKNVTITAGPSLTVDKTATPGSVSAAGATVTYSFVVHNTGNVSLSALAIDETSFSGSGGVTAISTPTCAPVALGGKLAPNATTTCTATYQVTQADINSGAGIDNTATASGLAPNATDPTVSPESSASVDVAQNPQLTIVKSVAPSNALILNQVLTYSFLVTNTGNVTVTNIAINDGSAYVDTTTPGFSGSGTLSAITCPLTTLVPAPAAGSSTTCTATYVVTQTDVDHGMVNNTATATGVDPSSTPVTSDPDTASVPATQTPGVSLAKSHDTPATPAAKGDKVTFRFVVTNTGNVTLDVPTLRIADTMSGLSAVTCPTSGTLAPGQTANCTATYTLTQADVDSRSIYNPSAIATIRDVNGNTITSAPADDTVPLTGSSSLTLDKTVSPTTAVAAGNGVTYSFRVTNTGTYTATNILIAETAFSGTGTLGVATCPVTELAPQASTVCTLDYTLTQADVDAGTVTNTAIAKGDAPDGSTSESAPSSAEVTIAANPSITIAKSADVATVAKANSPVNYTFVVTNTGNVTLNPIAVTDPMLTAAGLTVSCDATSLAPGVSTDCAASGPYLVSQAQIDANAALTNTATATGTPPNGGTPVTDTGSATVTPNGQAKLTLVKSADVSNELLLGTPVNYAFVVTNIGNMTIDNIVIDDSTFDGSPALTTTCPGTTLAPGASMRCTADPYTVTQDDIDHGHLGNTASATGTDPQDNPVSSDDSTWNIPQPAIGELTVTKNATESSVSTAGTVVHYTLTATNTTNVTLTHVVVSDGGVTNGATPAVTTPVTVSGCYLNGNNAATLDNSAGFQLEPGDVATCTATYTATQADIDAGGQLANPATASGTRPDDSTIDSNTADVQVPIHPATGLTVTKDPPARIVSVPGPITWTITATNTGSATLNGVHVADQTMSNGETVTLTVCTVDGVSVDNGVGFALAPGKSVQCTAVYQVTAADIAAGQQLSNTASASGTAVGGTVPVTSNDATATVDIAALTIVKSTTTGRVTAADQLISYTITATNTGTVPLTGVTVTDAGVFNLANTNVSGPLTVTCPAATGWASGVAGTLAPGDSVDCTASYQATQADVDTGGTLTNHATASGQSGDGNTVSAGQAVVTVPVQPPAGKLTLTKTADESTHLGVGDLINYSFVVTNSGGLTINNLTVDDSTFSGSPALVINCPVTALAPGESTTCTSNPYTVTQGDVNAGHLTNTATVTGTDTHNNPVTSGDSSWSIPQPPEDALVVTKDASRATVEAAGDQVNYTITAVNQGNVTLTGVVVTDAGVTDGASITTPVTVGGCYLNGYAAAPLDNVAGFTLNPGDVATCAASYTTTQADIDAGHTLVNRASASGVDTAHATVDSNEASTSVDVGSYDNLDLVKTPASQTVTAAGDVTWTVSATNRGTSALNDVKIVDQGLSNGAVVVLSGCAIGATPVDNDAGFTLPVGATADCTATYTVTAADVTAATRLSNTADASGTDPNGQTVDAIPATATVDFAGLQAAKTPSTTTVSAVGDVTWTVSATNTGSVVLNDVTVADPQMSNGGAVTVNGCRIGAMSVGNSGFTLAPQETVTCQATYTITQDDLNAGVTLTNTATATGTTSSGVTVPSNDATASVVITQSPALTLLKTADDTNDLTVGEQVHYSFLVTNTGNVALTNISIDDSSFSGSAGLTITCPVTTLAPNGSTTCTADAYTVTQDDVNAGELSNTATASGTAPDGSSVTSGDSGWDIPHAPTASVGIVETPSKASGLMLGDRLTFNVTATNTGNVPLTNVTVANLAAGWTGSGPMPDIDLTSLKVNGVAVTNGAFTLNPGEQVTYTTLPYTVLQADVDNNTPLANEATVVGTPPAVTRLAPVSANTTAPATMVAANAHVAITETPSQSSGLKAGDEVTFNIVATNNGNVTLHDVYLDNDPAGWTGAGPMPTLTTFMVNGVPVTNGSFSLAPGESVTCVTTPYTVSAADVGAAKPISNRVVVTGTPPSGLNLQAVTAATAAPVATVPTASAPSVVTVQTGGTMAQGTPAWLLVILLAAAGAALSIPLLRRGAANPR